MVLIKLKCLYPQENQTLMEVRLMLILDYLSKDKVIPITKIDILESRGLHTVYPSRSQASSSCGRKKKSVKIIQK